MAFAIFIALIVAIALPITSTAQSLAGSWISTASMTTDRSNAAAVLLPDGRVLITGGTGGAAQANSVLSTAELYDLRTGTFSNASPMFLGRSHHAAVLLKDGCVLISGGLTSSGSTNESEVYDPSTNAWTIVSPMVAARSGHTATPLQDGRVLIAGGSGFGASGATLEVFDPSTSSFSLAGVLTASRRDHASSLLADGRVLISGGFDGKAVLNSTEIYDPRTKNVIPGPSLATPRMAHTSTRLLNGQVLIVGGNNGSSDLTFSEIFEPASGAFASTGSLHSARSRHQAFLLPDNNGVLVVDGTAGFAELYQPWNSSFVVTGSPNVSRSHSAGVTLAAGGLLLMTGGGNASAELYRFATIKTDRDDYPPGDTVTMMGSGWTPGEAVTLKLTEVPQVHDSQVFYATADAAGTIVNTQFSPEPHDLDVRFYLTAYGSASQAQNTFKDGNATVSGFVRDSVTNTGISGATIQCSSGCNDVVVTTSMANGSYSFRPTFAGNGPATIKIEASAPGYHSATNSLISINNSSVLVSNFSLQPLITTHLAVSAAAGTYGGTTTLSAVLTGSGGSFVASKTITFTLNGSAAGSAITNSNGIATISGASLSGIAAGTYNAGASSGVLASFDGDADYLTSTGSNALTVSQKSVSPSITSSNKTYDGTADATFACTLSGVLGTDSANVNCSGGSAAFASAAAGHWAVTATGLTLTGASASNYKLSDTTAATSADITKATVSPSIAANNKTYDGSNAASFACSLSGILPLDSGKVSCVGGSATFASANVGTWAVTANGLSLDGPSSGNYALDTQTAGGSADITPLTVTASIEANSKVYDGTDVAAFNCSVNGILPIDAGNVLCSGGSAAFASANAGHWSVTATGLGLGGGASANYALSATSAVGNADITPLGVVPSIAAASKTYDGTDVASFTCSANGILEIDLGKVDCSGGSATFASRNAGNWTVTAVGLGLSGAAAANYALTPTSAAANADITPLTIAPSIVAKSKTYDGNDTATVTCSLTGVLDIDLGQVECSGGSATFASRNAGDWVVTATDLSLSGGAATNYALSPAFAAANADIMPLTVAASITANSKMYDGTDTATFTCSLIGILDVDFVGIECSGGSAVFANRNAGNWTVTATGLGLSGAALGNYALAPSSATSSADITSLSVAAAIVANNKVYDGTDTASFTCSIDGIIPIDAGYVGCSGSSATFASANVGNWVVTVNGLALSGGASGNYTLSVTTGSGNAAITPLGVMASINAQNKIYDGNAIADFTCILTKGIPATDVGKIGCSGGSATFASSNVGTWVVTATDLSLNGAAATNYFLLATTANDHADIIRRPASVSPEASGKYFGQLDPAPLTTGTLTGFIVEDGITATYIRTPGESVGAYLISATLNPASALGNYNVTYNTAPFIIGQHPTTITYTGAASVQLTGCSVEVSAQLRDALAPYNPIAGQTVIIHFGAQMLNVITNGLGIASGSLAVTNATQIVAASASFAGSAGYSGSASPMVDVSVTGYDANDSAGEVYFTGSRYFWTTSPSSSTATLTLSATVRADAEACGGGDVRHAKVSFALRTAAGLSSIRSAQDLPVNLVNANDTTVGTVSAVAQYNIGSSESETLDIAVIVGGEYGNAYDYAKITISKPGVAQSVTLNGTIANELAPASNGYLAGAPGQTTALAGKLQYNKNKTNPQGEVSVEVKSWNKPDGKADTKLHTYLVTSTSIAEFTVKETGLASFSAKATVFDMTDPKAPIIMDDGAILQLTLTDAAADTAGVIVYRQGGGVWFTSGWDGVKMVEKSITGAISIQ